MNKTLQAGVSLATELNTILKSGTVNCDVIIALDKGKIIEMGSHDELIAQKGYYYNLYTMQGAMR